LRGLRLLFLSLESTSAHHKRRGHAVSKVITYWRLQLNS